MDIRRTVLLADANEEFRTLVRKIIDETEEFSVVGSVGDGTEALRLAREEAPDLILMDVVLPGLDGFGVLKQLPSAATAWCRRLWIWEPATF